MSEHVVLVAFQVESRSNLVAQAEVMKALKNLVPQGLVVAWWIAEDDRTDGSDNDSAVFVHKGSQRVAYNVLELAQLTGPWNTVGHSGKEK